MIRRSGEPLRPPCMQACNFKITTIVYRFRVQVCVDEEDIEVCTTEALMDEYQFCDPESADCSGICRKCGENDWRCDNGECIKALKRKDGFPDCKDGSDERRCESNT